LHRSPRGAGAAKEARRRPPARWWRGLRRVEELLFGEVGPGLPRFCLERWQSLHETSADVLLSESGGEPPKPDELLGYGVDLYEAAAGVDLGYGWTMGSPRLREAIGNVIYSGSVGPGQVVVTNGGAEANLLAVLATAKPGGVVVVDEPNYMQVRGLLEARGARIVVARRRPPRWRLEPERLIDLVEALRPVAVYVTNPNNPTGAVERRLEELAAAAARHGTVLVFDEVYRGLELRGGKTPSILESAASYGAAAVSTGSMSKTYSLPGLRIGWAAASSTRLAEKLWAAKDYTTIAASRLSEAVATLVLERAAEALERRTRTIARRNLRLLEEACGKSPLRVHRPEAGAFTLIQLPPGLDDLGVATTLYQGHGVLVVPASCMGAPGYIRVGLGAADEDRAAQSYQLLCSLLRGLAGHREEENTGELREDL